MTISICNCLSNMKVKFICGLVFQLNPPLKSYTCIVSEMCIGCCFHAHKILLSENSVCGSTQDAVWYPFIKFMRFRACIIIIRPAEKMCDQNIGNHFSSYSPPLPISLLELKSIFHTQCNSYSELKSKINVILLPFLKWWNKCFLKKKISQEGPFSGNKKNSKNIIYYSRIRTHASKETVTLYQTGDYYH